MREVAYRSISRRRARRRIRTVVCKERFVLRERRGGDLFFVQDASCHRDKLPVVTSTAGLTDGAEKLTSVAVCFSQLGQTLVCKPRPDYEIDSNFFHSLARAALFRCGCRGLFCARSSSAMTEPRVIRHITGNDFSTAPECSRGLVDSERAPPLKESSVHILGREKVYLF